MLIDWFTVGAQVINFMVLVWLMRRFLYKPVLAAIDAREKLVAGELADAAAKKAEAAKDSDAFQHKSDAFDQQRAALLTQATTEAQAERTRLIAEANRATDALAKARAEALRIDSANRNLALVRRTQDAVFSIARKALTDLASVSLEARISEVFTRRLREMDAEAKGRVSDALKASPASALVRSALELSADQRAEIQNAINETFFTDIPARFETAPDLVSGIEFAVNGPKVTWSITGYLDALQKAVNDLPPVSAPVNPPAPVVGKA